MIRKSISENANEGGNATKTTSENRITTLKITKKLNKKQLKYQIMTIFQNQN